MTDQDFIFAPPTASVEVTIALEPAYSVLSSITLLSHPDERSGFNEWITKTAAALPPDRKRTHQMIFTSLFGMEAGDASSFPALLD